MRKNFYASFPQNICNIVWDEKYRYRDDTGFAVDTDPTDTFLRVKNALFAGESDAWKATAEEYLLAGICLPAGRIISGAGTASKVTMINCFVNQDIPDSMRGIMETVSHTALSMSEGGGVGTAFGTLRADEAVVRGKRTWSSGVLPFMDMWDETSQTIRSAGERRGAMMATLPVDHPDIIKFVTAKSKAGRLKHFNVSVLITDAFMRAVETGEAWDLGFWVPKKEQQDTQPSIPKPVKHQCTADQLGIPINALAPWYIYQTIPARELWDMILQNTYEFAEPGIIFIDRVNSLNPLGMTEYISATNPCGEQPLPPHGSCCLGAISLPHLVRDPFTSTAELDNIGLDTAARTMVRLLDNVLTKTRYPLEQQCAESMRKRRIGLGITGLADMLVMLGYRYGSPPAVEFTSKLMERIANIAYMESANLAKEKGSCPAFVENREKYLAGEFFNRLNNSTKEMVKQHGLRNGVILTIAPTGTTSLLNGNVSSGIEPIFSYVYKRKIIRMDTSTTEETVFDFAVLEYENVTGKKFDPEKPPPGFVCTDDLSVEEHVNMQAAAQHWVDSSISKTINCPKEMTFEQFKGVYTLAYALGCKGCTTYRPSDVRGSILSKVDKPAEPAEPTFILNDPDKTKLIRPLGLAGTTYKIKWNETNYYITLCHYPDGRPAEIFIESLDVSHAVWRNALCRALSALMRQSMNITFLLDDMKQMKDPSGGSWSNGLFYNSLPQVIAHLTDEHFTRVVHEKKSVILDADWNKVTKDPTAKVSDKLAQCSKCGLNTAKHENGCLTCMSCGYSNCG